ncbi:hypothetical protein MKX03_012414 [Papaver bracteatum]|nr:hypothetical protein MKX03_012414 [Papaver bracteatum]
MDGGSELLLLVIEKRMFAVDIPQSKQRKRKLEKKFARQEDKANDVDMYDVNNPTSENWLKKNRHSPWDGKKQGVEVELIEEKRKYFEDCTVKKAEKEKGNGDNKGEVVAEKSTFHGKEEKDYQGRSWIAPPKDAKAKNDQWHLLLSARIDSKVKIWDVHNSGKYMRTYMGHGKEIRDISFSNDGTKFLSTGYDKNIKYWDFKIWQVISTFSTGKDMNSGNITQEYDQHLGALNTITFVDDNRRFIILDNKILIYSTRERFHLNKKKMFAGHIVAGYACQVHFSPEGQYVMPGDGEGKCWFWNWKACKVSQTLKCHESVCIGVEWHPLE